MTENALHTETDAQRMMALPLRLAETTTAKTRGRLVILASLLAVLGLPALIVGIVLDRLFHDNLVTYVGATVPPLALIVGYQILKWRIAPKITDDAGPNCRVDIHPEWVLCRGVLDGDASWSSLTRFRWVRAGTSGKGHDFKRADLPDLPPPDAPGEYWIEAAQLTDDGATNEFGYYDRPDIQFELADFCHVPATRRRAEQIVDWLNDLRSRSDRGDLAAGTKIALPAWLNAASLTQPPAPPKARSNRPVAVTRG